MDSKLVNRNFRAFLWHAVWLALATTFTDVNTVLPGLIIQAGGTEIHVGILTGIMIGIPLVAQLLFAGFLSSRRVKRPYLLVGINLRVVALVGVAWTLVAATSLTAGVAIGVVYLWMMLFGLSGAFAGIAYTDILGKSITGDLRKRFFVTRQVASTVAILISALAARWVLAAFDYPTTYRLLFWGAGGTLLVASAGFWFLREQPVVTPPKGGILTLAKKLPEMLRSDANLRNYVLMANFAGLGTALLPFFVLLARDRLGLSGERIGVFLLVQIVGMLLSNFLWSRIVRRRSFRGVLLAATVLGVSLPFLAMLLSGTGSTLLYGIVFLVSGSATSARRIGGDGAIVEMSTAANRALYTGAIGALNLTVALFPLVVGLLLRAVGYWPVFVAAAIAMAISGVFVYRLDCRADILTSS
jgi:MFS family permease